MDRRWGSGGGLTESRAQDGVAAEVGDLHHHAVVQHAVGGLEASVALNAAGVEVGHALQQRQGVRRTPPHWARCDVLGA